MSTTSTRTIQVGLSGDVTAQMIHSALENIISPATVEIVELAPGNNTITSPNVAGVTVSGVTIIPPAGNTDLIILKGNAADVGVGLHKTDPSSIALNPSFIIGPSGTAGVATFILNAAANMTGVKLIWS